MNLKKTILLFLFISISAHVFSQVVNIEKKRKSDNNGFTGIVKFGFDMLENSKKIIRFQNGIDLQYKKDAHVFILLNEFKLMKVNENQLINDGFQHIRYNYTFKDSSYLTFESFVQHQYNTIKLIERRFLIGAGLRHRLVNNNKISVYLGTLGMYEYEQRSNEEKELLEQARLSTYTSISWNILDNMYLNHISYYQPSFKKFDNYRVASETALNIKITEMLFFNMALKITMESHPSEGINKTFYAWTNALQFKF